MAISVITGLPASGKSLYVEMWKGPEDIVIDFDLIAVAIGSSHSHDHTAVQRQIALSMWITGIRYALNVASSVPNVWIVDTDPSPSRSKLYDVYGVQRIPMEVDEVTRQRRLASRGKRTTLITPRPIRDNPQA